MKTLLFHLPTPSLLPKRWCFMRSPREDRPSEYIGRTRIPLFNQWARDERWYFENYRWFQLEGGRVYDTCFNLTDDELVKIRGICATNMAMNPKHHTEQPNLTKSSIPDLDQGWKTYFLDMIQKVMMGVILDARGVNRDGGSDDRDEWMQQMINPEFREEVRKQQEAEAGNRRLSRRNLSPEAKALLDKYKIRPDIVDEIEDEAPDEDQASRDPRHEAENLEYEWDRLRRARDAVKAAVLRLKAEQEDLEQREADLAQTQEEFEAYRSQYDAWADQEARRIEASSADLTAQENLFWSQAERDNVEREAHWRQLEAREIEAQKLLDEARRARHDITATRAQMSELERKQHDTAKSVDLAESRLRALESSVRVTEEKKNRFQTQLQSTENRLQEVLARLHTAKGEQAPVQASIAALRKELTDLQKKKSGLLRSIAEQERSLATLRAAVTDEQLKIQRAQDELRQTLIELQAKRDQHQKISTSSATIADLDDQISEHNRRKQALDQSITAAEKEKATADLNTVAERSEAKREDSESETRWRKLEAREAEAQKVLDEARRAREEVTTLRVQIAELQAKHDDLTRAIEVAESRSKALDSSIRTTESHKAGLQNHFISTDTLLERVAVQIDRSKKEQSPIEVSLAALQQELEALQTRKSELSLEIAEQEKALAALRSEQRTLSVQTLPDLRREHEDQENRLSDLHMALSVSQSLLQKAQDDLQQVESNLQAGRDHSQNVVPSPSTVSDLDDQISEHNRRKQELDQSINAAEAELKALGEQMLEMAHAHHSSASPSTPTDHPSSPTSGSQLDLSADFKMIKDRIREMRREREQVEQQLSTLREDRARLQRSLTELLRDDADIRQQVARYQEQLRRVQSELQTSSTRNENVQATLATAEKALLQTRSALRQLLSPLKLLSNQLGTIGDFPEVSIHGLENLQSLLQKRSILDGQLQAIEARLTTLRSASESLSDRSADIQSLQSFVDRLRERLAISNAEIQAQESSWTGTLKSFATFQETLRTSFSTPEVLPSDVPAELVELYQQRALNRQLVLHLLGQQGHFLEMMKSQQGLLTKLWTESGTAQTHQLLLKQDLQRAEAEMEWLREQLDEEPLGSLLRHFQE